MTTFWALIQALPEIIKLLQILQAQIDEAKTEQKVSDSVKTIHEAFAAKDSAKLAALFSGK